MTIPKDNTTRIVALLAGVLIADKVFGLFKKAKPGGDVTPAPGDIRPATLSAVDAAALADVIEQAVWGSAPIPTPTEDDDAFAAALLVCRVTADVQLLMNAYGERGTFLSPLTLVETVAAYLDDDLKTSVNRTFALRGITIRF